MGIVRNVGDGAGLEGWRLSVLELDPLASSRADDSMRECCR